jgi:hypothetical protein
VSSTSTARPFPNSKTVINLKGGLSAMTLASAVNVSGGGSTADVRCDAANNSVVATVNLVLVNVDAIN